MHSQADMVPASLRNVILSSLCGFYPNVNSVTRLDVTLGKNVISTTELVTCLKNFESCSSFPNRSIIDRLILRIGDFQKGCPICFSDGGNDLKLYGCCGYCVCTSCFDASKACRTKCPFCRVGIPEHFLRSDVTPIDILQEETHITSFTIDTSVSLKESLKQHIFPYDSQSINLSKVLSITTAYKYRRLIIVVEHNRHSARDLLVYLDIAKLSHETGVKIVYADPLIKSGKGTEFAKMKADFDNASDPLPTAIISSGGETAFAVGTNFDHVDCIVTIGSIDPNFLTQMLGRVFRPRMSRDNTKEMLMIKLYS